RVGRRLHGRDGGWHDGRRRRLLQPPRPLTRGYLRLRLSKRVAGFEGMRNAVTHGNRDGFMLGTNAVREGDKIVLLGWWRYTGVHRCSLLAGASRKRRRRRSARAAPFPPQSCWSIRARASCHARLSPTVMPIRLSLNWMKRGPLPDLRMRLPVAG